jgi:hypothetical protein
MRNGRTFVSRDSRRLFQYRFETRTAGVSLAEGLDLLAQARAIMASPELRKQNTAAAKLFLSWNAEGWYVTLDDSHLLSFTSEYQTAPPQEITNLFHEIEKLPEKQQAGLVQDICLGFCYDPVAALGFWYSNQHSFTSMRLNR